jgi:hypothetical protein
MCFLIRAPMRCPIFGSYASMDDDAGPTVLREIGYRVTLPGRENVMDFGVTIVFD